MKRWAARKKTARLLGREEEPRPVIDYRPDGECMCQRCVARRVPKGETLAIFERMDAKALKMLKKEGFR